LTLYRPCETRSIIGWTQGLPPGLTYAASSRLDSLSSRPSWFFGNEFFLSMTLVFVVDVERLAAMIRE
jgi:hypothetical protein